MQTMIHVLLSSFRGNGYSGTDQTSALYFWRKILVSVSLKRSRRKLQCQSFPIPSLCFVLICQFPRRFTEKTSCGARHNKPRRLLPHTELHWLVNGLIFEIPILGYFGAWGLLFGLYSYFQCQISRHILARRPRRLIRAMKFRAYLA